MISGSIGTSRSAVPGMMIVLAWARRDSPCGTRIVNAPVSTSSVSAHTEVRYAGAPEGSLHRPKTSRGAARSIGTTPGNARTATSCMSET